MNPIKFIWGFFFRLFPCPTKTGLIPIGKPDRNSPVLVTCNYYITVQRLRKIMRGIDAWLLVADSKGVNVWCAAGGDEFNTHSVVSAVKTSGIGDKVDHRHLILPPLGAPGIRSKDVENETGWKVKWGPVRGEDIPRYLSEGQKRDEKMKRVTYDWWERMDTAIGSMFIFYLLGAIGFAIFGRSLLVDFVVIGAAAFVFFMTFCLWLPGKTGLVKVLLLDAVLLAVLVANEIFKFQTPFHLRADLIIAMAMLLIYGLELGGLASTLPSDLDPFMAKLGIGAIGNVAFAETVRTELLNEYRVLTYYREKCIGCRSCSEICPQGVWEMDEHKRATMAHIEKCTACRACIVQCQGAAIIAEPTK